MVYEWKQSRFKADAQKVGNELEKIEYKNANSVLASAKKNKKSELHKCFTWEDSEAAELYRLDQARCILRMLVTVEEVEDEDGEMVIILPRAYESIQCASPKPDDTSRQPMTYIPVREALSDPELRSQIMDGLESTIAEAATTAKNYSYLEPALKRTEKKLQEARKTMRA